MKKKTSEVNAIEARAYNWGYSVGRSGGKCKPPHSHLNLSSTAILANAAYHKGYKHGERERTGSWF